MTLSDNAASLDRWSAEFATFALKCEEARSGSDAATYVRELAALLARTPPALVSVLGSAPAIETIESQLAAGASESAAILLAGSSTGFLVSRSPDGIAIASAWIPGAGSEQTLKCEVAAAALCGAIALVCRELMEDRPSLLSMSAIN